MKEIPLTNSSEKALVDDEDFIELSKSKWFSQGGYAYETTRCKTRMHQLLISCPPDKKVDHIDRNRLNNQRSNLRVATNSQNAINKEFPNRLGYRGVKHNRGKYEAQITLNNEYKYLGRFSSIHDAAKAYNEAAIKFHGEFAVLNKITQ